MGKAVGLGAHREESSKLRLGAPWLQPPEHSSVPGHEPAPLGLALPSCVISIAGSQAHC